MFPFTPLPATGRVQLLGLVLLALTGAQAQAQNARTAVLDADAAASVALTRVMARGWAQQAQAGAVPANGAAIFSSLPVLPIASGALPGQAVIRHSGLRQLVVVPGNIRTCRAELNIGTVQAQRPIVGDVNLQVVVAGNITQVVGGDCP